MNRRWDPSNPNHAAVQLRLLSEEPMNTKPRRGWLQDFAIALALVILAVGLAFFSTTCKCDHCSGLQSPALEAVECPSKIESPDIAPRDTKKPPNPDKLIGEPKADPRTKP